MTRLQATDILDIPASLKEYDLELLRKTGRSLKDLSCHAAGMVRNIAAGIQFFRIAVIPMTSGQGMIKGFSKAVCAIASHLGFEAFITEATDVAGLGEALKKDAHAILLSDDARFLAIDFDSRHVVDNSKATAWGYVAALEMMAGGLDGEKVLVIGCGPVGAAAVKTVIQKGAVASVFDTDGSRCLETKESLDRTFQEKVKIENDLETALCQADLIIEATPARDIIRPRHIGPNTYIAAPGVPKGLDGGAQSQIAERLIHDPLQIGVATMAMCAFQSHMENQSNRHQKS